MVVSRCVSQGVALLVLAGGLSVVRAQDAVPGGWAPQVGFQTFSGPGYSGGFGVVVVGSPGGGGSSTALAILAASAGNWQR